MRSLFLSLTLAAVAFAQQRDPAKGVNFYSIEKEIALGRQLAAEVTRDHKTLDSPTVVAYLDGIGRRLAPQMGAGIPFPYTFALIADNTPYSEAIALPGGFLFVPTSVILAAKDEDELAAILAHSIAHVESRDYTKSATKAELMNIATEPLLFVGGWTGYAIRQGAGMAFPLAILDMHRKQELAADRRAVKAMSAAGYDPAALSRYIERELARFERSDASPKFSALPPLDQRLDAIRAAISELAPKSYPSHNSIQQIQDEVRRLTSTH
jgi:predicted Zn-dependent protease